MKDDVKRERKLLRPAYSFEFPGKGIKSLNRKIARKRANRRWKYENEMADHRIQERPI